MGMQRTCIIGAGASGLAAAQVLKARGLPFDVFEKGSQVGGLWRYENDNGFSSAYRSLFINTSRYAMEYRALPMPDHLPDYPHHTQIAEYFDLYADHFGLREDITFNTEVTDVSAGPDGGWRVTLGDGRTETYTAVLVANGHHWNPRWPDPPFAGEFDGEVMHSHDYRTPDGFEDRNVLVLGIGNSAVDIACETSRVSRMTYLAVRRGAHVVPKYLLGRPSADLLTPRVGRLPFQVNRPFLNAALRVAQGRVEDYGLPTPDHKLGEAHPTVSSELLPRIGHGRIAPKPNIERLEGDRVRFIDGSVEQIDRIVYATGYHITFPFLSPELMPTDGNRAPLYRRVVNPDHPGLYFIGLVQPSDGAIMPISEAQAEWVADLLSGIAGLPSAAEMRQEIAREESAMRRRYVTSARHTIQIDVHKYRHALERERRRGRERIAAPAATAPRPPEAAGALR